MNSIIQNRLNAIRAEMAKFNLDAWFISGTDPHSSEYLPEKWQTRAYVSGFTGSYGTIVITKDRVELWTDSRYFIQAEEQLKGTGIRMNKLRVPDAVPPEKWLLQNLAKGNRVGIDAQCVSVDAFKNMKNILFEKNIALVLTPDFLDSIWENRPQIGRDRIFELDIEYCGFSRKEKQKCIAQKLSNVGADYHVVSMLDELAWLYNLRGTDINFNPVFTGFAIIGAKDSYLFVDRNKLSDDLFLKLQKEGIVIKEYSAFYSFLEGIKKKIIYIDSSTSNYLIYSAIKEGNELVEGGSIVAQLKALKNSVELNGFKNAMKKDGVALIEFLYWLKESVGTTEVSEYDIGIRLKECRAKQKDFRGESFPPIVGYKDHGAIVHLSVEKHNANPVDAKGILLFDSGGQYLDGTTDVTRTVALGKISNQQKKDFTLVLKGMIALTNARFPYGTKGCHLDILARRPLWENGMNYGHGTGHGVGHFLNVHEGPMAIRQEFNENKIEPGMVMSNEPAFYREGEYGIRTENMIVCVEIEETDYGRFLGFETLTLCPIDTSLILRELLTEQEIEWLNTYHINVKSELKPLLDVQYHSILEQLTRPI